MYNKSQELNLERYWDTIGFSKNNLEIMSNYLRLPLGKTLYHLRSKIHHFLCCGFKNTDKYNLHTKLCRYMSWEDVTMNWWDKIRYRIVTGYKFEE